MGRYRDVSVPLVPGRVPLYPGDVGLSLRSEQRLADGDTSNVSSLTCSMHCGTHIDAPVHFLDGRPGVDEVPLDALIGPAWVADATAVDGVVDDAALGALAIPDDATRVLLKTTGSALWDSAEFAEDFVALAPDAATTLVRRGVRLVGIDYLSIAPFRDPVPTHEVLLGAGVAVVESLDLRGVEPGWWTLTCLPLRIPGADGAPARAVLSQLG